MIILYAYLNGKVPLIREGNMASSRVTLMEIIVIIIGPLSLCNLIERQLSGSFHVKCGIYGFYNIKNEFTIIIKRKCLNKGIGSCEMMLKKLSC